MIGESLPNRGRAMHLDEPTSFDQIVRKAYKLPENETEVKKIVSQVKRANSPIQEPNSGDVIFLPPIAAAHYQEGPLLDIGPTDPEIPEKPIWGPTELPELSYKTAEETGQGAYAGCRYRWFRALKKNGLRPGAKRVLGQKLVFTFDQVAQVQQSVSAGLGQKSGGLEFSTTIYHYTLKLYNILDEEWYQLVQEFDCVFVQCPGPSGTMKSLGETPISQPYWLQLADRVWEELVGTVDEWWAATRLGGFDKAKKKSDELGVPLEVREWPGSDSTTYPPNAPSLTAPPK